MKHMRLLRTICISVLILVFAFAGSVLAEEEWFETEMELLSAGGFPEPRLFQTFAEDDFDTYLYNQLMNGTELINIYAYGITEDDLPLTLTYMVNDHPDLFFVGTKILYSMSGDYVKYYKPEYLFTGDDLTARQAAFDASVEEIAAYANEATTTIGKLLRVNDYFCTNYAYDTTLTIFRPDQIFSGGTGVCQAYMLGYAAVLDELGIPNTHATSTPMKHTWNVVQLGDSWYHIDVTWNDPLADTPLQASHSYFLLSDAGMTAAEHYEWASSAVCESTTYDSFFWQGIRTPLAPIDDVVYYLSTEAPNGIRSVMKWTPSDNSHSRVLDYSTVMQSGYYYEPGQLGAVAADDDYIYYGACGIIRAAAHDGSNPQIVYSTGEDDVHVWSCALEDGVLSLRIGEANGEMSVVTCPADQRLGVAFEPAIIELLPGETLQLEASINLIVPEEPSFTLASSDTDVVTIDASNRVTAAASGVAYIIGSSDSFPDTLCPVIVHTPDQMVLPAGTLEINEEAFYGTAASEFILPEGLKSIGANAFADCGDLALVHIPGSVETIDETAFPEDASFSLVCVEGSTGAGFAEEAGVPYILLPAE